MCFQKSPPSHLRLCRAVFPEVRFRVRSSSVRQRNLSLKGKLIFFLSISISALTSVSRPSSHTGSKQTTRLKRRCLATHSLIAREAASLRSATLIDRLRTDRGPSARRRRRWGKNKSLAPGGARRKKGGRRQPRCEPQRGRRRRREPVRAGSTG